MTTETFTDAEDDPAAAAVAEYLSAREAGRPFETAEWLGRHPALADDLRDFVGEADGVADALRAFRGSAREPDLQGDERFVGDYELLEKVGGNMGIVYRARQRSLPREVAVKLLLRAGAGDRARFRAEAEAMARLDHPHVARILEVSRAGGAAYFSMEWFPGGTLAARVAEFPARPDRAAALVERVARAVHFAHRRGILHRDLKPANMLFDEFDQPRVADFGLAVPLAAAGGLGAVAEGAAGTPAYMAPEQLTGEVTVATDVYGLGAVLYELLTGGPPHAAATLAATLDLVRASAPTPPARLNPRVDPDLDAVCRKCLAADPAGRYGSAAELADDLERYRQGRATVALPLGPLGRVAHAVRQARGAADFRAFAPGLFGMAGFTLASNAAVFGLLRSGAAEGWVWAALLASYAPLFGMLVRDRRAGGTRHRPAHFHLWSIWAGHAAACLAVFAAHRLAAGGDLARGFGMGYVGVAGLNTLAFVVMGSLFAGRQYLLGLAWAAAAVGMGASLAWAPLIYAGLMAACTLLTGLQLRALRPG